jgi:hypothetical protein
MTFLSPALLFGLIAAGLPVVIHLLTRPKLRKIRWAAMKLLQQCLQRTRRRSRVEDLLLLLLRCLLVALLVLIFARPALLTRFTDVPHEAVTAVILLDDSASMQQTDGIRTRFDLAKARAGELLSSFGPDSACALYLISDRARGIIPRPTQDLTAVRHAVDEAVATDGGSNLETGVETALNLLKSAQGQKREIYVVTDSQLAAWRDLNKIRELVDENKAAIGFHVITMGDQGEDNLAVSGLHLVGFAAAIHEPVRCAVVVSNWSGTAVQNIPVTLATDGDAPQDQAIIDRIEPGSSRTLSLSARFNEAGYHSITATIPGDRLSPDNRRSTALRVIDQLRALIIEGPPAEGSPPDGFFLEHALTPVRPEEMAQYYLKTTTGPVAKLDSPLTGAYEVVFLSNVAQLSPVEAKNLRDYVDDGGALVVFPGPATNPDFYNNDPSLGALLPAKLKPAVDAPSEQKFLTWQSADYQHPVTALWNDPQSGTLASAHFTKYFPLLLPGNTSGAPPTETVVNYSDGEPAVVERDFGKGRVFLFSSTATTAWNDLPIHSAFVPLLLRTVAYATSGPATNLDVGVGQTFSAAIDLGKAGHNFYVERPGHPGERHLAGQLEPGEEAAWARYGDTNIAGVYRLFTDDSALPLVVFTAQMDPAESNLQQQPASDLAAFTAGIEPVAGAPAPPTAPAASPAWVPGRELWFDLAVAALVLALLELGLAHRFSQP